MANLSQDDFAEFLMLLRQAGLLLVKGIEKWLIKKGYLRSD